MTEATKPSCVNRSKRQYFEVPVFITSVTLRQSCSSLETSLYLTLRNGNFHDADCLHLLEVGLYMLNIRSIRCQCGAVGYPTCHVTDRQINDMRLYRSQCSWVFTKKWNLYDCEKSSETTLTHTHTHARTRTHTHTHTHTHVRTRAHTHTHLSCSVEPLPQLGTRIASAPKGQ